MVRIAVVGAGKMGISHIAMLRAHPDVELVAVCDSAKYVLDILTKYTGITTYTDYDRMLEHAVLDAVVIATPTVSHYSMAQKAIVKGRHVFCEKPLTLNSKDSQSLADLAVHHHVVTQVGYHNKFVGAFREAKRLLDLGSIGRITHALAESYGPVVLQPKGSTWRNRRESGGGCLYDYAAHTIDLVNWYLGPPESASGTIFGHIFSENTEDEVYSTLKYSGGSSAHLSVNWSDESCRKMTTKITIWGTQGKISVDRQECQTYLRESATLPSGYTPGWNVRYTTDLTEPVWFYLRGEEYSAELDQFVRTIKHGGRDTASPFHNSFASAAATDAVIDMLVVDNSRPAIQHESPPPALITKKETRGWLKWPLPPKETNRLT